MTEAFIYSNMQFEVLQVFPSLYDAKSVIETDSSLSVNQLCGSWFVEKEGIELPIGFINQYPVTRETDQNQNK